MNITGVGEGKVSLIAGGGRLYADVAARFTRSEKDMESIIASDYDANLVRTLVESNHGAALEFDYFLFGIEGYARVTEVQLVRKRMASYLIKSGRVNKKGRRSFDAVLPEGIEGLSCRVEVPHGIVYLDGEPLDNFLPEEKLKELPLSVDFSGRQILEVIEEWYNHGVAEGYPEEDLRYLKPQATEFKAIVGMNAHALRDWFMIRCCQNAQTEIRDLAMKMLAICKEVAPDEFFDAGPSCVRLGYCPEKMQNKKCNMIKKADALRILSGLRALPQGVSLEALIEKVEGDRFVDKGSN